MSKHRVLLIGAGDMGSHHARAWNVLGHELHTVIDLNPERAEAMAEKYDVKRVLTGDYDYQVGIEQVDIVDICVPLEFHAPLTIYAAEHGKHVFCEKPIARTFKEIQAMQQATERANVKFGIGFQRNLAAGVAQLRDWATEGVFGHPMVFSSDLLQEVRPKRFMHDRNSNNGPIVDACCHYFLLWQTVFRSRPKTVYARGGIIAKSRQEISHFEQLALDTAVITIEFESNDIGAMTVSWGLEKDFRLPSRPDRIIGPHGGAEAVSTENFNWDLQLYHNGGQSLHKLPQGDLFEEEIRAFVEAVDGVREAPFYGIEQGKQMLALSLAVIESIDTGRPVDVNYNFDF